MTLAHLTLDPSIHDPCPSTKYMLTLGIETSCDETAAAVLRDDKVLSSIVSSQIDIHKKYGGVVPELASREHLKNLMPVIREALAAASVSLKDINLIAVTYTPGLIGALLVGVSAAKAIAYAQRHPLHRRAPRRRPHPRRAHRISRHRLPLRRTARLRRAHRALSRQGTR